MATLKKLKANYELYGRLYADVACSAELKDSDRLKDHAEASRALAVDAFNTYLNELVKQEKIKRSRKALDQVMETIAPTETPFLTKPKPMISNDQKMTISLIENMDELKLKIFLFHNLESIDPHLYKLLFSMVDESKLPVRIRNCFINELGFEIFHYDLILRNDKFFKYIPNFGKKSLKLVKEYLSEYGLKLNTDLKDIKYEALKSLNLINLKHDYLFVENRGFIQ